MLTSLNLQSMHKKFIEKSNQGTMSHSQPIQAIVTIYVTGNEQLLLGIADVWNLNDTVTEMLQGLSTIHKFQDTQLDCP